MLIQNRKKSNQINPKIQNRYINLFESIKERN